jgi:hypothetical protein
VEADGECTGTKSSTAAATSNEPHNLVALSDSTCLLIGLGINGGYGKIDPAFDRMRSNRQFAERLRRAGVEL